MRFLGKMLMKLRAYTHRMDHVCCYKNAWGVCASGWEVQLCIFHVMMIDWQSIYTHVVSVQAAVCLKRERRRFRLAVKSSHAWYYFMFLTILHTRPSILHRINTRVYSTRTTSSCACIRAPRRSLFPHEFCEYPSFIAGLFIYFQRHWNRFWKSIFVSCINKSNKRA